MTHHKILLVDPDAKSAQTLGLHLRWSGCQVIISREGNTVPAQAREHLPSIIILGAALPDALRLEICRQLQPDGRRTPVIILSDLATEEDRIRGFEAGADDYIAKPFGGREVTLRVKKSLERRANAPEPPLRQKIVWGALVLDSLRHEVTLDRELVHLTPIEFRLLELLMQHLGGALERKAIHRDIWPDAKNPTSRTIDAHLKRLRGKLGAAGRAIETINGFGYRLNESLAPTAQKLNRKQVRLNELVFGLNRLEREKVVPGIKRKLNAIFTLK